MTTDHQFWAPCKTGAGDRPRNVQLWAIVGSSNAPWPWPWTRIGSRSHQCIQYVEHYQHAQPCDCSVTQYRNVAIWILWNMDTGRSLNSRDSFPRRKFKNQALISCSPGPILWPPAISFELHTKPAEEIDLEKCTFHNFGNSVTLTLTLDRVEVTLVRTSGRGLPTHQIRWKSEKLFVDIRTDTPEFQSTRSSPGDDLKINNI